MPPVDAAARRVIVNYAGNVRLVRSQVRQHVESSWRGLDAYRTPDIERFAHRVAPIVTGGQRQVASLTDGYLATMNRVLTGSNARPVGIPAKLIDDTALRGVDALDVYRRCGPTVWAALSNGTPFPSAVAQGLDRALTMASTDLQLAKTHSAREALTRDDRVVGYARVPGGANVCDLCDTASTNRYNSGDLMPIHNGCYCDVAPIYGDEDPGRNLDLGQLADDGRLGDSGSVEVHDHGELGPVLTVAGQNFTGPDDLD